MRVREIEREREREREREIERERYYVMKTKQHVSDLYCLHHAIVSIAFCPC